jgi:hypothetical protein
LVSVAVDRPEKELLGSSEALQSSSDRVLQMLGKALSMDVARKFFRFVAQKIIGRRRGR